MAIKIQHGDVTYIVEAPEEAVRIGALLQRQDIESGIIHRIDAGAEDIGGAWTPDAFNGLIERLGGPQQTALSILVARRHVTDEYLRTALNVSGNQALAGILSGISKQATALGIAPRTVFRLENLRNSGKRRSIYSVAPEFSQIAAQMNWPSA